MDIQNKLDEELAKSLQFGKDEECFSDEEIKKRCSQVTIDKKIADELWFKLLEIPIISNEDSDLINNPNFTVADVSFDHVEFMTIRNDMRKYGYELINLKRIENNQLFITRKLIGEQLLKTITSQEGRLYYPNIQYLYHMSKVSKKEICEYGLDLRYSRVGLFGNGIYFSDDPRKCDSYWTPRIPAVDKYMYKCRVFLGKIYEYKEGIRDSTLIHPPRGYDSVKGIINYPELIIYDSNYVIPEFICTYR